MITKENTTIQRPESPIPKFNPTDRVNKTAMGRIISAAIVSGALIFQQGCTTYPGSAYPGYYGTYPGMYQQYPQGYRPSPIAPNYQQPQTSPGNSYYPGYYPPGYSPVNPQPQQQAPIYQNNSYSPYQQPLPKYQQSLPPTYQENNNDTNKGIGYNQYGTYYDINYNGNCSSVYNTNSEALQCAQRN